MSRPLPFFACFAPRGDRLSLDAWLRARSGARTLPAGAAWPQRLMQISLLFVYVFSVPAKPSDDIAWLDGTALYYVMASANSGRFPELAPLVVRERRHFAVKFAAGALRVASVVFPLFAILGALGAVSQLRGVEAGPFVAASGAFAIFFLVFELIYAVTLWGFADALILIADTYDAQRVTQQQISELRIECAGPTSETS